MKVKEIMTEDVEWIDSISSLYEAAEKMKSLDIDVLVVEAGSRLVGLLTDRDIVIKGLGEQHDPTFTQVKDIARTPLVCCSEEDSIKDALELMEEHQVARLLVCNQHDAVTGIISLGNVVAMIHQHGHAGFAPESLCHAVPV
jgi:CBS domain-containing protein